MITQEFNLNLIPSSAPVVVHVDQYDHGTGRLVASLYDGDTPYVPTNPSVYIQGTKPDGKYFISSTGVSIEGNVITADLIKTMTQVAGRTRTQFVVTEPTGRTGTFVFWLDVQETAMPDDSEISDTDISMIENAVETVQEAVIEAAEFAQASSDNKEDSEAWAKGTRNGEDVPSTDETYHNNAKYYAEQAAQAAAHGGHTIKNENGTAMTARTNLQFANADVEDDAENDCTVVTPRGGTGGSKIVVTTSESSLHNKNVTISDGTTTVTEQFSTEGVATFTGITMTGTLTITSTDGTETATDTLNVPYYGSYTKAIAFVTFNATLNISTSASSLYGQTITIKKGSTTVGTTAFSSGGSASYVVHETGEYTAECEGYSGSATVSAETTYPITINAGLDLDAWITAGSTTDYPLNPSSYADFSALEADEAAVRQLMLVHDAVDYLATASAGDSLMESVIGSDVCAKWINLSDYALDTLSENANIKSVMDTADKYGYGEWVEAGQVPTMTGATTPSGEVTASRYNSTSGRNDYPWIAFTDAEVSGSIYGWYPATGNTKDDWIQYTFPSAKKIKCFTMISAAVGVNDHSPRLLNFKLYGVNGSTETLLGTFDNTDAEYIYYKSSHCVTKTFSLDGDTTYEGYKFVLGDENTSTYNVTIYRIQLYTYEPKGNVPIMTANNAPYGTAIYSSEYGGNYVAWKAFDGSDSTEWYGTSGATNNYVGFTFVNPVKLKKFKAIINNTSTATSWTKTFKIQGSNDGFASDIHDLKTFTVTNNDPSTFEVNESIPDNVQDYYLSYRLFTADVIYIYHGDTYVAIKTLQFYGHEEKLVNGVPTPDYSEKEFAQGSTRKTIYDHGVKPSGAITASSIGTSSNSMTEESNQLLFSISGSSAQAVVLSPSVDMSDYDYLWVKVGSKATSSSANFGHLRLLANASNFTGQKGQFTFPNPLTDLNPSLDVIQINEGVYIAPCTDNAGSSVTHTIALTEIYVE